MSGAKNGRGCIGRGCGLMVIIAVLLIVAGVWDCNKFADWIRAHASGAPSGTIAEGGTRDEYEALLKRLDAFKSAAPGSSGTLEITARDLNLLIAFAPEWQAARGKVHAAIDKDQIGLTGGLPLNSIPSLEGQYLNGEIDFTVAMNDKVFHMSAPLVKLKGAGLSSAEEKILSSYWMVNLTNNLIPIFGPALMKTKTLKVEDGKIVLISG